ncbi:hypothetical protein ABVT39_006657 [Epinephelus coioides]
MSTLSTVPIPVYQSVHALLCTAGRHGKGNCGETLPQIDSLNMEGFSQEKIHNRILGLSTKQLLKKEQDRGEAEQLMTLYTGICVF